MKLRLLSFSVLAVLVTALVAGMVASSRPAGAIIAIPGPTSTPTPTPTATPTATATPTPTPTPTATPTATATATPSASATPVPTTTPSSQSTGDLSSLTDTPTATPVPAGGAANQLPNTGGVPADGRSRTPYAPLLAVLGGVVFAGIGLTALRQARRG